MSVLFTYSRWQIICEAPLVGGIDFFRVFRQRDFSAAIRKKGTALLVVVCPVFSAHLTTLMLRIFICSDADIGRLRLPIHHPTLDGISRQLVWRVQLFSGRFDGHWCIANGRDQELVVAMFRGIRASHQAIFDSV